MARCCVILCTTKKKKTLPVRLWCVILISRAVKIWKEEVSCNSTFAEFLVPCLAYLMSDNLISVLVIRKLHNKAYSIGLALSTLWNQLSLLPVPYSKEQMQMDDYGLCQCCKALIEFTKPFVEEVIDKENSLENEKLKDELLKL